MKDFIIVSYFTLGTQYQEVAHKYLMNSLINFSVRSDVREVPNLGSWQLNTSFKPRFIKQMLNRYKENIVFLDCDSELMNYPQLFADIPEEFDIGVHLLDKEAWYQRNFNGEKELLSGTLFLRNNDKVKRLVDTWADYCESSNDWEQRILQRVLKDSDICLYELPIEYCFIKTLPNGSIPNVTCEFPIVAHNQVSRTLKNLITAD